MVEGEWQSVAPLPVHGLTKVVPSRMCARGALTLVPFVITTGHDLVHPLYIRRAVVSP